MTERIFEDILIYYAVVNAAAFVMFGLDKAKARAHMWRIRERTLLFAGAIGGAGGALAGMLAFHHKVRRPKFLFLVPLFLAIHLAIIGCLWLAIK